MLQHQQLRYDSRRFLHHYYLCHYRPRRGGADRLSNSLLRFKKALPQDIHAWIDCSLIELEQLPFPKQTIVLRALGSEEIIAEPGSQLALDQLGRAIAAHLDGEWMPFLLHKKKTRKIKYLDKKEREQELQGVYQLSQSFDLTERHILIIDDILTTGTTVLSIARMIRNYYPSLRFRVFTLARSDYDPSFNGKLELRGEHYRWDEEQKWKVAEEQNNYGPYENLKNAILNDAFQNP